MKQNKYSRDCCYEEMKKGIGGQSIPSEYIEEPYCNEYEMTRKNYNSDGIDQSGMEK